MSDCLFCKIAAGEIPSKKVYEDERVFAFHDINPQSPAHILVVPKAHAADVLECAARRDDLLGHVMGAAAKIAEDQGLGESGFRLVTNCGADARQSVAHFHVHIMGGAKLSERMV